MAKILIGEDDSEMADFLKRNLAAKKHQCIVEPSGPRLLRIAKKRAPDLFMLDTSLADMSVFELCRQIRRAPDLYRLPILLLSEMAEDEEIQHAISQGVDEYVVKPFSMDNLLKKSLALVEQNNAGLKPDALTGLPGRKRVQRAIQHRISRKIAFSLAYIEFLNIQEFSRHFGMDARDKAILWLTNVLRKCGEELGPGSLLLGHVGGGHFVCILKPEDASYYCAQVRRYCQTHRRELYVSLKLIRAYDNALKSPTSEKAIPILDVAICVTNRPEDDYTTTQDLFEILSQIRQRATREHRRLGEGGVHVDRRKPPPS